MWSVTPEMNSNWTGRGNYFLTGQSPYSLTVSHTHSQSIDLWVGLFTSYKNAHTWDKLSHSSNIVVESFLCFVCFCSMGAVPSGKNRTRKTRKDNSSNSMHIICVVGIFHLYVSSLILQLNRSVSQQANYVALTGLLAFEVNEWSSIFFCRSSIHVY